MAVLHWQQMHPGWNLWLRWMLGSIAGAVLLLILSIPLNLLMMGTMDQRGPNNPALDVLLTSVTWMIIGGCLGIGQWWALRREIPGFEWWIPATVLGFPLGSLIQELRTAAPVREFGPVLMLLSFGLALGVLQWLVLRPHVPRAGWWVLISLAGWALAIAATGAAYLSGLYVEPFDMLSAFLVPVIVTGVGIVWLLQPGRGLEQRPLTS